MIEEEKEFVSKKREVPQELYDKFELLPSNKPNVSFSEIKCWYDCSYRHFLDAIQKLSPLIPGIYADYGTAVHAAHEYFILTGELDKKLFIKTLYNLWKEHEPTDPQKYTTDAFKQFVLIGKETLDELPKFYNETFPDWEPVDAEHLLFEQIDNHPHAFKGYIDAIIKYPQKKKMINVILDVKSCGWGWTKEKKSDESIRAQLILYKHYWTRKLQINPKDTRCGYVLLKRIAKPGKHIEFLNTSVGDVTTARSLKMIDNMITSVKRGIKIKNKESCKYCPFKNTQHCV